jgi:predicted RNase H-like HicB family nuclease
MIDPYEYSILIKKVRIDDESLFVAAVRELPDLKEYAPSYSEAYELIIEAIQLLYELAQEMHRDFPLPKVYQVPMSKLELAF